MYNIIYMISKKENGFTLIELLIVIAIIGILASVVLISVNNARTKAKDTTIKNAMDTIRKVSELEFINLNGSYNITTNSGNAGFPPCTATTSGMIYQNESFQKAITQILSLNGNQNGICVVHPTAWAIVFPLSSGDWWCIDSTGRSSSTQSGTLPGQTTGAKYAGIAGANHLALTSGDDNQCN